MTSATTTPAQPTTFLQIDTQAPHYKWVVAAIVLLAGATQTFAGPTINIAIPRLMAAFGTDLAQTQWVATAWLLTRTLVMPRPSKTAHRPCPLLDLQRAQTQQSWAFQCDMTGPNCKEFGQNGVLDSPGHALARWLGGMLGNRNLFVGIMVGFVITTAGCGLATSLPMMITFRLAQGLVMGTAEGLTAVIMVTVFPPHQRGMALGLRAVGWSAGQVIFYTAGGYLMEEVSWRLIFFIGIPTGVIAAVAGFLVLPQQRDYKGEPVDSWGLAALGSFLVPLLLFISFGRDDNIATSTLTWLAIAALVGGGLFVARELMTPHPAVNLRLFRLPIFRIICVTAFFNNLACLAPCLSCPFFSSKCLVSRPCRPVWCWSQPSLFPVSAAFLWAV